MSSFATITVAGIAMTDGVVKEARGTNWGRFRIRHTHNGNAGPTFNDYDVSVRCYMEILQEEVLQVTAGNMVCVTGDFRHRTYTTKDGREMTANEITATSVMTMSPPPATDGGYDPFSDA